MLNKLTIRKQSNLNNLIKIANKFIENEGDITYFNYKEAPCRGEDHSNSSYFMKGNYKEIQVVFYIENDDEIIMETDLDVETAYQLYILIAKY